jgi:hypothetical protein
MANHPAPDSVRTLHESVQCVLSDELIRIFDVFGATAIHGIAVNTPPSVIFRRKN